MEKIADRRVVPGIPGRCAVPPLPVQDNKKAPNGRFSQGGMRRRGGPFGTRTRRVYPFKSRATVVISSTVLKTVADEL